VGAESSVVASSMGGESCVIVAIAPFWVASRS
jgi:hypothetical protein